jgi:hypothetical protein
VLTAAALLAAAAARPTVGAGLLAFAGALKLWPLAGLPALVLPTDARQRGRLIAAFVAVCAVLGCATIAEGGMQRLLSPFAWQQARGLQVEALAALPFLWARLLDGAGGWTIVMSRFNCYEVQGPGVDRALAWSMIAMLLGLLGAALMYLRAFRSVPGVRTPALAIRLLLLTVLILLITNKAFSPQYLVWLAAPLAVLGVLRPWPLERVDSVLFLAGCVLTQVVYPLNYAALVAQDGPVLWVLGALTLRDVLLIVLGARLAVQAWRMSAREQ